MTYAPQQHEKLFHTITNRWRIVQTSVRMNLSWFIDPRNYKLPKVRLNVLLYLKIRVIQSIL